MAVEVSRRNPREKVRQGSVVKRTMLKRTMLKCTMLKKCNVEDDAEA